MKSKKRKKEAKEEREEEEEEEEDESRWNHFKDSDEILFAENNLWSIPSYFFSTDPIIFKRDESVNPKIENLETFLGNTLLIDVKISRICRSQFSGDLLIRVDGKDKHVCEIAKLKHDKYMVYFIFQWRKRVLEQHCFYPDCQKKPVCKYLIKQTFRKKEEEPLSKHEICMNDILDYLMPKRNEVMDYWRFYNLKY